LGVLAFGRFLRLLRYSRIPEFAALYEKLMRNKKYIIATLKHGLSTGKLEATNNVIKSIIRRSFGFRNVDNLIAMILWRTSSALDAAEQCLFHLIG